MDHTVFMSVILSRAVVKYPKQSLPSSPACAADDFLNPLFTDQTLSQAYLFVGVLRQKQNFPQLAPMSVRDLYKQPRGSEIVKCVL